MIGRQIGEDLRGLLFGQHAENERFFFRRQGDDQVGHVGWVQFAQPLAQLIPIPLMDDVAQRVADRDRFGHATVLRSEINPISRDNDGRP